MNQNKFLIILFLDFIFLSIFKIFLYSSNTVNTTNIKSTNTQKFKLSVQVERKEIPLNKNFNVTITISYLGSPDEYIITSPYIEKLHNLEIIGNSSENIIKSATNSKQMLILKKYTYIVKPQTFGQAYFPVTRISISDKKGNLITELQTQPIEVSIVEPEKEKNFTKLILTLIIILLSIGIAISIFILIIKNKRKKELKRLEEEKLKNIKTPEDIFFENTKQFDTLPLKKKLDKYISEFKICLEKIFSIKIKDKTTEQTINILKSTNIEKSLLPKIENILKESDLIRFTPGETDTKKIEKIINEINKIISSKNKISKEETNEQRDKSNQ